MYGQTAGQCFVVLLSRVVRERDMLLIGFFTQFIFLLEYPIVFQTRVNKKQKN